MTAIPAIIAVSKPIPRRSSVGSTRNRAHEGITSHRIDSAKSATWAESPVSLYNHVRLMMLARGSEITNAPNTADLFAISLAATITAPLKSPLPARLNQFMGRHGRFGSQACRLRSSFPAAGVNQQTEQDDHHCGQCEEHDIRLLLPLCSVEGVGVPVVP